MRTCWSIPTALADASGERRVDLSTGVEPRRADREPRVWLRVADNGPGVSSALRARVFEPYFTTKAEGLGTGLGLAVSRSMARDHGGELVLEPASAQGGASFRLSLPISGVADPDTEPAALPEPGSPLQARLLVVDDETELAALMRDMLEGAGYEVATAESGLVALALLDSAHFDAIVSVLAHARHGRRGAVARGLGRHPSSRAHALRHRRYAVARRAEFLRSARCASLDKPFSRADLLAKVAALLG